MLRQISSVMLALGVILASVSVGTSAFADDKKADKPKAEKPKDEAPKNQSSSPREKIYDLKDGTHVHIITLSDGRFLVSITYRNGRHYAYAINPRTGQTVPVRGNVYSDARMPLKGAAVLALVKPLIFGAQSRSLGIPKTFSAGPCSFSSQRALVRHPDGDRDGVQPVSDSRHGRIAFKAALLVLL